MIHTKHKAIYYRLDKQGRRTYYLRIYHGGKNTWRAAGSRLEDAIQLQMEVSTSRAFKRAGVIRREKIAFSQLADEYMAYYRTTGAIDNQKRVRSLLGHLVAFFGPLELQDITPWSVEGYARRRIEAGKAPRTVNTELDYLRAALGKAVEWGFLETAPKVRRIPVHEAGPARDLSPAETALILTALPEHQRDATIIALATGMRIGEIYRLTPEQWDRDEHVVSILKTKAKRVREVPVAPHVEDILERRFKQYNGRLFPYPTLANMVAHFVYERKQLYRRLGRWRFHDLRHTFATMLMDRGASPKTVMEILGHHSLEQTTRYTHTDRARKREAVALLPSNQPSNRKSAKKKPLTK